MVGDEYNGKKLKKHTLHGAILIMKTLVKSTLGLAIAAAVAANSVQAAETATMDPSLEFTYKNFYWDEDAKNNPSKDRQEWVHGLIADFDSGYVNNLVGAVVTVGYAGPLDVKKDSMVTNLPAGSDGEGDAISGFQQAYLKTKTTFSGVDMGATLGVKKRSTQTYSDSGSRMLAASSTGFDLMASFGDAEFYFTEITGVSGRSASTLNNRLDEELRIYGASYSYEGLDVAAEYGEVDDGKEQTFLMAAYGFELDDMSSVDLDVRYGKMDMDDNSAESKYFNLNGTFNYGNGYVGLGYNKTKDGDYEADYDIGGNNDNFNSSLSLWADFNYEGEQAYVLTGGYNFADQGLEGLTWDLWYAKGDDADNYSNFDRKEIGSYLSYAFDGSMEGLSVAWLYTNYRIEGMDGSTDLSENDVDVNRLYLTYSVAAF